MENKRYSIRELVAPIVGGYWGQTSDDGTGNARVIRNGDVKENGRIGSNAPLRQLTDKEIVKAQLLPGDIVITMSGNVGRTAFIEDAVDHQDVPYVASNFVKILRPDSSKVLPKYLFYSLRSPNFENECSKYTRGVAIQNLSTKIFDQPVIKLPPLEEQKRIVELLDEAALLMEKRSLVNQKMTEVIPALFEGMFKGKRHPKEKLSDLITQEGAFRTGPFGSQLHHAEFTAEGIPVLGIDNVVSNTFRWTSRRCLPPEKYVKFKRYRVYPNDVLVTIMGTVGRVCVAPPDLPECMSTKHLCVITVDKTNLDPIYLWASLLYDSEVRHQTRQVAKGAIMEGWNSTIIKNLKITHPPLEEQEEFAEKVRKIWAFEEMQRKSTEQIADLYTSLTAKSFA